MEHHMGRVNRNDMQCEWKKGLVYGKL